MAEQKQVKKTGTDKGAGEEESKNKKPSKQEKKLSKERKKLMDEIDDIIDEQGEDFVENYVQRGGE